MSRIRELFIIGATAFAAASPGWATAADPSVGIDLPKAAGGGTYTFEGPITTDNGAWLAGAQAIVKVTNKAGGAAIPPFLGQVNATQTRWGPTGGLALAAGKYTAVVELRFTHATLPAKTMTALVDFEITAAGGVKAIQAQ